MIFLRGSAALKGVLAIVCFITHAAGTGDSGP